MAITQKHSSRLKFWGMLSVTSAVSLGSIVSATPSPRSSNESYVVSVAAMSLIISILYVGMTQYWARTGHDDYMNKAEPAVATVLFMFWAIAIGIMESINTVNVGGDAQLYVVQNGNVYYFTWASFFLVLAILGNSLQGFKVQDGSMHAARTSKWAVLLASSLVVMASSVQVFRNSSCKGQHSQVCKSAKLGIGMGCCCAVLVLAIVGLAAKSMDNADRFLQIETVVSLINFMAFAAAVAVVTGPGGAGSFIGNLYYATWISFTLSTVLLLDCGSIIGRGMGVALPKSNQDVEAEEEGMEAEMEEQAPAAQKGDS